MPGPNRPKKIPIERTSFRATIPFSFTPLSAPENKNQKPIKKTIKLTTITDSMLSILFPPLSLK